MDSGTRTYAEEEQQQKRGGGGGQVETVVDWEKINWKKKLSRELQAERR